MEGEPMKRPRIRRAWVLAAFALAITLVSTGCGSGSQGPRVLTAAERLAAAFAKMAARFDTTADDAARALKVRFPASTETELADEAEGLLQRTSWLDDAAARLAAASAKTAKVVHKATCKWLDEWDRVSQLIEADQAAEFEAIIVDELRREQLSEDQGKISEVWAAVSAQFESLRSTGSLDTSAMSIDLVCLLPS